GGLGQAGCGRGRRGRVRLADRPRAADTPRLEASSSGAFSSLAAALGGARPAGAGSGSGAGPERRLRLAVAGRNFGTRGRFLGPWRDRALTGSAAPVRARRAGRPKHMAVPHLPALSLVWTLEIVPDREEAATCGTQPSAKTSEPRRSAT